MQTETIQESAKLKQNFQFTLSRLGHEIRNPIALISSELQLMASSHPEVCRFEQCQISVIQERSPLPR